MCDYDMITSDDFMVIINFGKPSAAFKKETLIDEWFTLKPRKGKKDVISGDVRLRIYYSVYPESRPARPQENVFFYEEFLQRFKTGDLIAYDGIGILDTLQKIRIKFTIFETWNVG